MDRQHTNDPLPMNDKTPLDTLADGFASTRSAGSDVNARLGTARWMTTAEALHVAAFDPSHLKRNADGMWEGASTGQFWLGIEPGARGYPLAYGDDRHVTLVAAGRSGKGAGFIVPNLCLWPGSCIVIDPKGENAAITARRRGKGSKYTYGLGQTVWILDPYDIVPLDASHKGRFNPLDAIDPRSKFAVAIAARIAASIVDVDKTNNPFWENTARALLKDLILHVVTASHFEGQRNLVTVWRLLKEGDWIAYDSANATRADVPQAPPKKDPPSPYAFLWEGMRVNKAFGGLISGTGREFKHMDDKMLNGVLRIARTDMSFLDDVAMRDVVSASDFTLDSLKLDPSGVTIYLTLPQNFMETHFRWLRIMIDLGVGEIQRRSGRPATGHPILFVLDEFAGLKKMEVIEHGAAQAAGAGIKFLFILQNLPQLKTVYDSWETFLDCSGLKIFFSIDGITTREYLSKQLGEMEVWRENQSGSASHTVGNTDTVGKTATQGTTTTDGRTTTTGRTMTSGRTTTHGTTDTIGSTDTFGHTLTRGATTTLGKTSTHGNTQSIGAGSSRTRGNTSSETLATNEGEGGSSTGSGPSTQRLLGGTRDQDQNNWALATSFNRGSSHSRSMSLSDTLSSSDNWSNARSISSATSQSEAVSYSQADSTSTARSRSRALSNSIADSESEARSDSVANSRSVALSSSNANSKSRALSISDTSGKNWGEGVHKRPLLNPDEIGRLLARVDDEQHPHYPGLVVALISGQHPLLVRRINYYQSSAFAGLFDPNPEHAAILELAERIRRHKILKMLFDLKSAKEKEEMEAGDVRRAAMAEADGIRKAANDEAREILAAAKIAAKQAREAAHRAAEDLLAGAKAKQSITAENTEAKQKLEKTIEAESTEMAKVLVIFIVCLILIVLAFGVCLYIGGTAGSIAMWSGSIVAVLIVGLIGVGIVMEISKGLYSRLKHFSRNVVEDKRAKNQNAP